MIAVLLLAGCSSNNGAQKQLYEIPEDAQRIFDKYNAVRPDETYNVTHTIVQDNGEGTIETAYFNFKDNFDYSDSLVRVITPQTFKKLIQEQDELSQIYICVGDKNNQGTHSFVNKLYDLGTRTGMPSLYVDLNDIYQDEEVNEWFRYQFYGTDEEEVIRQFFQEGGYAKDQDINILPDPIIILWWNNAVIDYRAYTPNFHSTKADDDVFYKDISEEGLEYYPLGCQEIKEISRFK